MDTPWQLYRGLRNSSLWLWLVGEMTSWHGLWDDKVQWGLGAGGQGVVVAYATFWKTGFKYWKSVGHPSSALCVSLCMSVWGGTADDFTISSQVSSCTCFQLGLFWSLLVCVFFPSARSAKRANLNSSVVHSCLISSCCTYGGGSDSDTKTAISEEWKYELSSLISKESCHSELKNQWAIAYPSPPLIKFACSTSKIATSPNCKANCFLVTVVGWAGGEAWEQSRQENYKCVSSYQYL